MVKTMTTKFSSLKVRKFLATGLLVFFSLILGLLALQWI